MNLNKTTVLVIKYELSGWIKFQNPETCLGYFTCSGSVQAEDISNKLQGSSLLKRL